MPKNWILKICNKIPLRHLKRDAFLSLYNEAHDLSHQNQDAFYSVAHCQLVMKKLEKNYISLVDKNHVEN
jgi:hypothetical protein